MAARWGMLALCTLLWLGALGAVNFEWQPSALRLLVCAVVGLLAPLLWPGISASLAGTVLRVVAWSGAAALAAALVMLALLGMGHAGRPAAGVFASCALLWLMLLLLHTGAALLEAHWQRRGAGGDLARQQAGASMALLAALLGSLPLWLGPLAELLLPRAEGAIDVVLAASPLTHLAVASGNDLMRNPWLYQHSNLAALPFAYPELSRVAATYAAIGLGLVGSALWLGRQRQPVPTARVDSLSETLP